LRWHPSLPTTHERGAEECWDAATHLQQTALETMRMMGARLLQECQVTFANRTTNNMGFFQNFCNIKIVFLYGYDVLSFIRWLPVFLSDMLTPSLRQMMEDESSKYLGDYLQNDTVS
jgi:hypothetical protein